MDLDMYIYGYVYVYISSTARVQRSLGNGANPVYIYTYIVI